MPKPNKDYELAKSRADKGKEVAFATSSSVMLRIVNHVRTILARQNGYVYIPDLSTF